jgi:GDP-4-dehydro-6-deoxy-D-mannose reductase
MFNLLGPGMSERLFVGRIQKQIDEIIRGDRKSIEIGTLSATRDYLQVEDAADQLEAIVNYGKSGNVYHVASGQPVTMRNILDYYLSKYNLDNSIVHESEKLSNRVGYDVPVIYADLTKTLKLINSRNMNELP